MMKQEEGDLWEWDALKGSVITRLEWELEESQKKLKEARALVLDLMKQRSKESGE